ncbi:hypothetical protein [Snodgrassella sp. ESL0253]|uniref:hypothetical protein n=1 Tax=Snodgrassella sp. ESL0253 TaxID=2705031 RepID=UPI0015844664|nr:hypothetical protein [Snodgrassella sp. ESL0253]NUE67478.1 hypothetical protein [Snodgrassella sp. ESL0253]
MSRSSTASHKQRMVYYPHTPALPLRYLEDESRLLQPAGVSLLALTFNFIAVSTYDKKAHALMRLLGFLINF